jgi:hypothetical protein
MTDNYKKALHDAREELVKLLGQKEEIDQRVERLRQAVDGLAALCGEEPQNVQPTYLQSEIIRTYENILESITGKPGLTDAIRAALKAFGRPMTPIEVRDGLISLGYDLSVYSNVLASIHTALKRLHESREITKHADREGKVSYEWNKPPSPQWGHMIAEAMVKEEERELQESRKRKYAIPSRLSQAVHTILANHNEMTPDEIKDRLVDLGFPLKGVANIQALLDSVWKRSTDITMRNDGKGKITYRLMTEEDKEKREEEIRKRVAEKKKK